MRFVDNCRLCEGKLVFGMEMKAMPLVDDYNSSTSAEVYPVELFSCISCGLVQLGTVVEANKMFNSNYAYRTGSSPGLVKHFKELAIELVNEARLTKDSFVVDIGCNDGTLLKLLNELSGCHILGIDPVANETLPAISSPFSVEVANRVIESFGAADLVIATNVLAHVDDVKGFLILARNLLKPNGIFVCEVGSFEGIVRDHAWETIYHEHLSYFSKETLSLALYQTGFTVEQVVELPVHGGSLRAIGSLFKQNQSFVHDQSFDDFDVIKNSIIKRRNKICDLLDNEFVAAFGASAKASVIIWQTGIKPKFVADDNPLKMGRWMPGTNIPIVSRSWLENLDGKLLVLAWNEAEAIMKSLPELVGRFVVAAPEPYVA